MCFTKASSYVTKFLSTADVKFPEVDDCPRCTFTMSQTIAIPLIDCFKILNIDVALQYDIFALEVWR